MGIFGGGPSDTNRETMEAEKISRSSSTLIPEAAGRGERLLETIERVLSELVPDIQIKNKKKVDIKNSKQRHDSRNGLLRDAIILHGKYPVNGDVLLSVQDYGKDLILSAIIFGTPFDDTPIFDQEVARAYFELANQGVAAATEAFAKELKLDAARIKMGKGLIDIT